MRFENDGLVTFELQNTKFRVLIGDEWACYNNFLGLKRVREVDTSIGAYPGKVESGVSVSMPSSLPPSLPLEMPRSREASAHENMTAMAENKTAATTLKNELREKLRQRQYPSIPFQTNLASVAGKSLQHLHSQSKRVNVDPHGIYGNTDSSDNDDADADGEEYDYNDSDGGGRGGIINKVSLGDDGSDSTIGRSGPPNHDQVDKISGYENYKRRRDDEAHAHAAELEEAAARCAAMARERHEVLRLAHEYDKAIFK